jgi:acetolactate synthase-1/2/3 large subunit
MNIQELATAHVEKIAAKAIILNNQHLGMVVQWEDNFYAGNRGTPTSATPTIVRPGLPRLRPRLQFVQCEMRARDVQEGSAAAIQRMLDSDDAYVLDVSRPTANT